MESVFNRIFSDFYTMFDTWLSVAYVVSMTAVIAFRPERIARPELFRRSYYLFGLYLVTMPLLTLIVHYLTQDERFVSMNEMMRRGPNPGGTRLVEVGVLVHRALFALSFISAMASMLPHRHGSIGEKGAD